MCDIKELTSTCTPTPDTSVNLDGPLTCRTLAAQPLAQTYEDDRDPPPKESFRGLAISEWWISPNPGLQEDFDDISNRPSLVIMASVLQL